jgi:hypothetical protein
MQFSDFAEKETSALLARVSAGSAEASRQHLHAFKAALDAAGQALEAAVEQAPNVEAEVADLVGRLTEASVAAAEAAAQRVAADAQIATDALRSELSAESKEKEKILVEVGKLATEKDRLAGEKDKLIGERDKLASDRDKLAAALTDASAQGAAARAELKEQQKRETAAKAAADAEVQQLRGEIDRTHAESAGAKKRLDAIAAENASQDELLGEAQTQIQAADAKLSAVSDLFKASAARVKALEHAEREHEQALLDLEAKFQTAVNGAATTADAGRPSVSLLDDLLGGFQALSSASTIPDVVTTFMEQVAAEFPRVALFRVKGNRLQGEHHIGFDVKTDITKVALPLGMDSLLTRAASTGRIERLTGSDLADSSRTPFGGTPACALALPIVVHGETLGIVYADDSGQPAAGTAGHELRSRIAEALLQHAVALLMRLTTELRNLAELRAYAASLLTEIEQMYIADVKGGKSSDELHTRLKSNVEYARSIYANRVAFECPDAAALLDDQIVSAVDVHGSMPFGRDLAVVAKLAGLTVGQPRSAAEAS